MSQFKKLLAINNLHTSFSVKRGTVKAVNDVSFSMDSGEMLGIVGESGCGKSVTGLSILRLVPYPGRITAGEIIYENRNLLSLDESEMRLIRGGSIAMIFQDPMTSLNPVLTIARQLTEAITTHTDCTRRETKNRAVELLKTVGIPSPEKRINDYRSTLSFSI